MVVRATWSRKHLPRDRPSSRELWARGTAGRYNQRRGGAITLVNPATADTLAIPPLPSSYTGGFRDWHRTYSFAYHPAPGQYKIVHVPRCLGRVLVFTLGDASWRDDVKIMVGPAARCGLDAGIVSSDGKIYLTIEDTEARVVSFDLDNENFTSVRPLPSILSRPGSWSLAEVHGRLAIAFSHVSHMLAKTEVWVMEGVPGQLKWNCWYILETHKMRHLPKHLQWQHRQRFARPHFAHGGEHVLTRNKYDYLFIHETSDDTRKARHGVVEVSEKNHGTRVCDIGLSCSTYQETFVYVETMEPLSVYKCW
ncbi:hypothetical protein ACQ4PT_021305 [Festuca glaucescens]